LERGLQLGGHGWEQQLHWQHFHRFGRQQWRGGLGSAHEEAASAQGAFFAEDGRTRIVVCVGREMAEAVHRSGMRAGRGTPRTKGARLVVATRNPAGVGSGHRVANPQNGNGLNEASSRRGRFARNHGRFVRPQGVLGTPPLGPPQRGSRRPAGADADGRASSEARATRSPYLFGDSCLLESRSPPRDASADRSSRSPAYYPRRRSGPSRGRVDSW